MRRDVSDEGLFVFFFFQTCVPRDERQGVQAFGWWAARAAAVLPGLGLLAGRAGLGLVQTIHVLREEEAQDRCGGVSDLLGLGPGPKTFTSANPLVKGAGCEMRNL